MNFDFSDEQRLLSDSVNRLMADSYDFAKRQAYARSEEGFSHALWAAYAELGLLALPFDEADGGIGGGPEDVMIVMEAIGRALALEPYLTNVVITAALLSKIASQEQRRSLVAPIIAGSTHVTLAHSEPFAGYHLTHVETRARQAEGGFRLEGNKTLVLNGGTANKLLVSARLEHGTREEAGIGLFVIDADISGLSRRIYRTQDGMKAAEIVLHDVHVGADALLGGKANAGPALLAMADEANAALCSEAVGAMDHMLKSTVDYLKTRKQFGQTIGQFQALQHKAADMVVELEQARSMALYATMMSRLDDASSRALAVSSAKWQVCRSARLLSQACVQLHGGIGMTMEHAVGHYLKRLTMIEKTFGDSDFHMDRLAEMETKSAAAK